MKITTSIICLALFVSSTAEAGDQAAAEMGQPLEMVPMETVQTLEYWEASLQVELQKIIDAPPRSNLSVAQLQDFGEISEVAITMRNLLEFRKQLRARITALEHQVAASPNDETSIYAIQMTRGKLQQTDQLRDLRMLALQSMIQRRSVQIILTSQVSKFRHDTAKTAIDNMRS